MGMYKVEICGVNTAKLPLLSEEEKKELFDKIGKGDRAARETFIKGNLRLVLSIIQRFYNSGENIDDLFQIGCIGLMKAVDHFDVTMNVKFSTYAVPMKQSDREPTIEELAKILEIPAEDIVFALDAIQSPVSLYEPVYAESGDTLYILDQISDKKNKEEKWVEEISLKAAIDRLADREHQIINMRYFEGKTQMEVAEEIQISQAQVSRLEKKALREMKNYLA